VLICDAGERVQPAPSSACEYDASHLISCIPNPAKVSSL
jgi:hypothetical protein